MIWPPQDGKVSARKAPIGRSDSLTQSPTFSPYAIPVFYGLALVRAAESIRHRNHVDPGFRPAFASGTHELVGADVGQLTRMSVIRVIDNYRVLVPGVRVRQTQGQFVGLGSGVDQKDGVESGRQSRSQSLRICYVGLSEVAGIRVQPGHLVLACPNDERMAVPHVTDVVVQVQIGPASLVDEVGSSPPDELDRVTETDRLRRRGDRPAASQEIKGWPPPLSG